jgi:hypothetical protein
MSYISVDVDHIHSHQDNTHIHIEFHGIREVYHSTLDLLHRSGSPHNTFENWFPGHNSFPGSISRHNTWTDHNIAALHILYIQEDTHLEGVGGCSLEDHRRMELIWDIAEDI